MRVEGWMADLADRLAHRRSEFFDKLYARRGRRAEGFRVGWYRFTDSVGVRWERLTDRHLAWRKGLSGRRAERGRQSVERRSPIMLGAMLCITLVVTMVVLIQGRAAPTAPPNAALVKPSRDEARGIAIPDVRGMPASDARAQLERAGLEFAGARAALGAPGQVLWTQPNIGRSVPLDTPVTIVIGVEAERIGSASRSPLPSAR